MAKNPFAYVSYALVSTAWLCIFFVTYNEGPSSQEAPMEDKGGIAIEESVKPAKVAVEVSTWTIISAEMPKPDSATAIMHDVPFTSQAPFGNWWDLTYQEWCEEASVIMALAWAKGEAFTPEKVDRLIKEISEFEDVMFWTHVHTSVHDTAKILSDYFGFDNFEIRENITKAELIRELRKGNIVLAPTAGRELKNMFYTPPGPLNHMVPIIGYEETTKELITNDSGTKNWAWYRYGEDQLFNAIGSYPTGSTDLESSVDKSMKSVIVISKG